MGDHVKLTGPITLTPSPRHFIFAFNKPIFVLQLGGTQKAAMADGGLP